MLRKIDGIVTNFMFNRSLFYDTILLLIVIIWSYHKMKHTPGRVFPLILMTVLTVVLSCGVYLSYFKTQLNFNPIFNSGYEQGNYEDPENQDSFDNNSETTASLPLKTVEVNSDVSVLAIEKGVGNMVNLGTDAFGNAILYTPNDDHRKGNALMCKVIVPFAETVPLSTDDDRSDPRYTPYISGTYDYIIGEVTYKDKSYFNLLSGVKIEKKDVETLTGFIMPMNTMSLTGDETSNGNTRAVITTNWKVPFISEIKEQRYFTGYSGRVFNVSKFNSKYIDFTFSYTNACENSLNFKNSNVIKSAEWVNIGENGTCTLRVYFKNAGVFYGYKAYYSSDNRLVLEFKEKPNKNVPTVLLDAGHGGKDCGAIAANGAYESDINYNITMQVKNILESKGYNVVLTRNGNSFVSLDDRQSFARSANADIVVAIHNNSSTDKSLSGTEVYYYRGNSLSLAKNIHSQLVTAWQGAYSDNPDMYSKIVYRDGGVRFYPFRVNRIEECPSVLVECGYLSHITEAEYLCQSSVQDNLAQAIANGIINYFSQQ